MTAFEDFVNNELPRRSALLTKAITSYDDNPNDSGAPAILKGSPLGTWFFEETAELWWRKKGSGATDWFVANEDSFLDSARLVAGLTDNTTIYVDPAGDDSEDGLTPATAIQTLQEASRRVPARGKGSGSGPARVKLAVGDYQLPDIYGAQGNVEIFDSIRFHSISDCIVDGTEVIDGTFTVQSTTANTITVTPDPGWTIDEWVGYLANWDAFPGWYQANWIIGNTSNTLTVAVTEVSVGGWMTMPTTSVRIEHLGSRIIPPSTNPTAFENALQYNGRVLFQRLHFDGDSKGPESVIDRSKGSNAIFLTCKFNGGPNRAIKAKGDVLLWAIWIEGCLVAGIEGTRSSEIFVDGDCVFKDNAIGVSARGASVTFNSYQSHWHLGNAIYLEGRVGAQIWDLTNRLWAVGGGIFVNADVGDVVYVKNKFPLVVHTGHTAISEVFRSLKGTSTFELYDSTNYVITPTTAFINDGTAQLSLADFLAGTPPSGAPAGSISAPKSYVHPYKAVFFFEA